MSRAQNRFDTKRWKKKRKNHSGDKCKNAKCGICSYYKLQGNSVKGLKKTDIVGRDSSWWDFEADLLQTENLKAWTISIKK